MIRQRPTPCYLSHNRNAIENRMCRKRKRKDHNKHGMLETLKGGLNLRNRLFNLSPLCRLLGGSLPEHARVPRSCPLIGLVLLGALVPVVCGWPAEFAAVRVAGVCRRR